MNLLAPLANLFRTPEEREQRRLLTQLETDLRRKQVRLLEAWDDLDNRISDWERERDAIMAGGLAGRRGQGRDGNRWPLLRNMEDLIQYRAASRDAVEGNGYGAGMLDRAIDFVIGDGMQPEVTLKGVKKGAVATGVADADGDGQPDADAAVQAVQAIIDEFRRLNDWGCGEEDREEEGFRRSQRDGEVFVRFFDGPASSNGIPFVRWIEPEQVDAPPGSLPNERWGIRYKPGDVETKEAYYAYELDGIDGEWVDASEIVHHKLGTDRTVLRGVPQFWLVAQALSQCETLNGNIAEVAGIQAKIALIRQHMAGLLPGQITDFVTAQANVTPTPTVRGRTNPTRQLGPGAVVMDTANGEQLLPGPVSQGVPGFVQGLQSRLRQVCARFGYPEFFTGDASNNNYASSLTAGGPAEKAFKRRQQKYAAFQAAVYTRACEYAVRAGRLSAADLAAVEIKVKASGVAISNKLEEAQVQQIRVQNKLLSPQTAMVENGHDPRVEMANIQAFDDKFGMGAMGLGVGGGGMDSGFGESVRRESTGPKGPPPFEGAVFDPGRHRWVKPGGGEGGRGDQQSELTVPSVRDKYARILRRTPDEMKPEVMRRALAEEMAVKDKVQKLSDTKVVSPADGGPLLVYHGTSADFDTFSDGPTFFTPDTDYSFVKDSPTVHAAYVSIKNPYYTTSQREIEAATYAADSGEFIANLKRQGYDGIIHADKNNPLKGPSGYGDDRPQVLVFSSNQIIPAGKFDQDDFQTRLQYGSFDRDGAVQQEALSDYYDLTGKQSKATGESYTQGEYELLSEADRSHLVRKTITNSKGRKQVVWVRANANDTTTQTRQQVLDARTLVAKAVNNPNSLNPEEFKALAKHLETVNRDEIRNLLKQVGEKVGGQKVELANRLVEKVKAGRDEAIAPGAAMARGDTPVRNPGSPEPPLQPPRSNPNAGRPDIFDRATAGDIADMFKNKGFNRVEVSEFGFMTGNYQVFLWSINPRSGNRTAFKVDVRPKDQNEADAVAKVALGKANKRDQATYDRMRAERDND